MARKEREIKFRILNAVCSALLLGAICYAFITSFDLIATGLIAVAIIGVATPAVISGDGIFDMLLGIFEGLIEGLVELAAGILSAIANLFN